MVPATYRDLLTAIASSAGALTGLLFVALSVAPHRAQSPGQRVIQQVRAAAALVAFTSALAVSLFTLVPGTNIGYPAVVTGIIGIAFTAASTRSIYQAATSAALRRQQTGLIVLLVLIYGGQLVAGSAAIAMPSQRGPQDWIGYTLVAGLLLGISRAWELIGDRDTGLLSSLMILFGRPYAMPGHTPDEAASGSLPPGGHPPGNAEHADRGRAEDPDGGPGSGD